MNPMVWRNSPAAVGAGVAAVAAWAMFFHKAAVHLNLTNTAIIENRVEAFLTLAGFFCAGVGAVIAFVARFCSNIQRLTWTKAGAAAKITATSQVMQALHDAIQASPEQTLPPGTTIQLPDVPKKE